MLSPPFLSCSLPCVADVHWVVSVIPFRAFLTLPGMHAAPYSLPANSRAERFCALMVTRFRGRPFHGAWNHTVSLLNLRLPGIRAVRAPLRAYVRADAHRNHAQRVDWHDGNRMPLAGTAASGWLGAREHGANPRCAWDRNRQVERLGQLRQQTCRELEQTSRAGGGRLQEEGYLLETRSLLPLPWTEQLSDGTQTGGGRT